MILTPPAQQTKFELKFNPLSPLPGKGPSEVNATIEGGRMQSAMFTDTQNPTYIRSGSTWSHDQATPDFAPKADSYVDRLMAAAEALSTVPADSPEPGFTGNGRFELTLGDKTWTGSLLRDGRGPVHDAVSALESLAKDLKRGVPGVPNSV